MTYKLKPNEAYVPRDQSGREVNSVPPLVEWAMTAHLPPLQPLPLVFTATEADVHKLMRDYGALCRRQALEEVIDHFQRKHELCKTRHNYWQCAAIEIGELK
jgi:hypothetical protein